MVPTDLASICLASFVLNALAHWTLIAWTQNSLASRRVQIIRDTIWGGLFGLTVVLMGYRYCLNQDPVLMLGNLAQLVGASLGASLLGPGACRKVLAKVAHSIGGDKPA